MNWVVIAVAVIFLVCILMGIRRGAIRIAVSLVTTLFTLLFVTLATPYVADAITDYTPMDEMIVDHVSSAMTEAATDVVSDQVESLTGSEVDEETQKAIEEAAEEEGLLDNIEIPRDTQQELIANSDMPDIFKNLLTTNNNDEIYEQLGVNSFAQYVGNFLAKIIINIVAFLGTFLIVTIILRAIVFALDIVTSLPVLGLVNRLAGGVIGAAGALIIVWILFIVITLAYPTFVGKDVYETIQANQVLEVLYDNNPIMNLATKM